MYFHSVRRKYFFVRRKKNSVGRKLFFVRSNEDSKISPKFPSFPYYLSLLFCFIFIGGMGGRFLFLFSLAISEVKFRRKEVVEVFLLLNHLLLLLVAHSVHDADSHQHVEKRLPQRLLITLSFEGWILQQINYSLLNVLVLQSARKILYCLWTPWLNGYFFHFFRLSEKRSNAAAFHSRKTLTPLGLIIMFVECKDTAIFFFDGTNVVVCGHL